MILQSWRFDGVDSYADSDALALAIVPIGTQAYQADTGSFKIYRGASGWAQMDEFPTAPTATQAQGSVSGYTSGVDALSNTIDKFPFAADGNATDVGDLTQARQGPAGQSSTTSGYTSGGHAPPQVNTIDKFSFAADGNATDVGDLTVSRWTAMGQSSDVSGYTSGGRAGISVNPIDKFPFASDANATDVGDTLVAVKEGSGSSSTSHGYIAGGEDTSARITLFKSFPLRLTLMLLT